MAELVLKVNGKVARLLVPAEKPLLWVLRENLGLTGAKFGCGKGLCGACTVLVGGKAVRACQLPAGEVGEREVLTIEGLPADHPVPLAWLELDVPQCGYCQPGQILTAVGLLREKPVPADADIDRAMTNICRCGTYPRIRAAIHQAARGKEHAP